MSEKKIMDQVSIFISGYSKDNLQTSKEKGILGWIQRKKELKIGDYVFIYNITDRVIDTVFKIESPREDTDLIWQDEKSIGAPKYKNRWNAELIQDNIGISINEIIAFEPFNGSNRDFNLIIRNPFPTLLNDKFKKLRELLLSKSGIINSIEKEGKKNTVEDIDNNPNYFLVQVSDIGSMNILDNGFYQHTDWNKTPRDNPHGQAKAGDILLVYFARKSKQFGMTLKKGYVINSITEGNIRFNLSEILSLNGIQLFDIKKAIDSGKLRKEVFGKLSQQGFNIIKIEKEDWNQVLDLDKELFEQRYENCRASFPQEKDKDFINRAKDTYNDFIKLYPYSEKPNEIDNLTSDKLFQKGNKKTLLHMVQYWASGVGIHSGNYRENIIQNMEKFKGLLKVIVDPTLSLAQKVDAEWEDIPGLGGDKLIAKKLIYIFNLDSSLAISTLDMEEMLSNLNIDYKQESTKRTKKHYADLTLGEKYQLLTELLLEMKAKTDNKWDNITFSHFLYKCVSSRYKIDFHNYTLESDQDMISEKNYASDTILDKENENIKTDEKLLFPSEPVMKYALDKISSKLLVDTNTVLQIVINLLAGKSIIIAGPVGTGKTTLATMISELFWKTDTHEGYYSDVFTATADWSSHDVIGGIVPRVKDGQPTYEMVFGCVSETILNNWSVSLEDRIMTLKNDKWFKGIWLIIDEFNRADIDKVFGQLLTSLETRILKVPVIEGNSLVKEVKIPMDYRIICTLNTADKHYLFRLSDALKRRFAYIELLPPRKKDKDLEIFYALKNATEELTFDSSDILSINLDTKIIDREKSDQQLMSMIDKAYEILDVVRIAKPLGTAILKSIYKTLIVGIRLSSNYENSLDVAINSNLLPQLESTNLTFLESIFYLLFRDPIEFFREKHESNDRDQYQSSFKSFLIYIGANKPEITSKKFLENIDANTWDNLLNKYEPFKISRGNLDFPLFRRSFQDIISISMI